MGIKDEQMRMQYITLEEMAGLHKCNHLYDSENGRIVFGERSISLAEYSFVFTSDGADEIISHGELPENGIFSIFEKLMKKNGRVVWADLGCGNAIAMRQAKKHFKEKFGIDNLVAFAYDALPPDRFEYELRRKAHPQRYSDGDWNPEFEPGIRHEDIKDVVFPESPDLVTCVGVLQWARYPLEIFANAASQVKEGAYLAFTRLDAMQRFSNHAFNFESLPVLDPCLEEIPGFDVLRQREYVGISITVLKRNAIPIGANTAGDFMYGFSRMSSINPTGQYCLKTLRTLITLYTKSP